MTDNGKRIHFMGIGGVGMAGLAFLLKARGSVVSGCDLQLSARTVWLERNGIPVAVGHDVKHVGIGAAGPDELIVTPAVRVDEPERLAFEAAHPEPGRVRFRGEVLAELVSSVESIAVCGSHGKTTTSTWIAMLLKALGEDPSWCIGGETGDFPVAHAGKGPLVVEADESDGTLALYHARTLVVNKCEYDHPDHFPSAADYFACYDAAKRQAGEVIDAETLPPLEFPAIQAALSALPLHNYRNARAAVEVALRRGHRPEAVAAVLPAIVSVLPDRRFQRLAEGVYTDYAHHPTEMACAVQMARRICRGTLRVLFQPHRYSRTKALLKDFPAAFKGADEVVLCPTYAAFERPIPGGDIADLYRVCRENFNTEAHGHGELYLARSCDEAWEHARNAMADGDLTLLLGAGDIIHLAAQIRRDRAAGFRSPEVKRIWIGAGSNTWKSDLKLAVDYVKTSGPAGRPGAALGIPWMAGIPGTVGGWIKMNAGAFGHSISEVLRRVKVDGRWIDAADCGFGYRTSGIEGEIQDYELSAIPAGSPAEYLARRKRFPAGTWGSFFKNPSVDSAAPVYAGALLEAAGAKELKVGGAYVWSEHSNVIVAGEGATASDVLALARLMHQAVWFRFGIDLEPEVQGIEVGCNFNSPENSSVRTS